MDLKEFYIDFITRWYNEDNTCPFVKKCRSMLEEEGEFFEMALQQVRSSEYPYKAYDQICNEMFADGVVHMGRLCSLFAFSMVLTKTFPNIQELLITQLKNRQVEIGQLKKWE